MWIGKFHQKGSKFQSESGTGVYSIVQILGRGSNIPVWIGVPACLEKGCSVTLTWNVSLVEPLSKQYLPFRVSLSLQILYLVTLQAIRYFVIFVVLYIHNTQTNSRNDHNSFFFFVYNGVCFCLDLI